MSEKMQRPAHRSYGAGLLSDGHAARCGAGGAAFRRGAVHQRNARQRHGVFLRLHDAVHVLSEL